MLNLVLAISFPSGKFINAQMAPNVTQDNGNRRINGYGQMMVLYRVEWILLKNPNATQSPQIHVLSTNISPKTLALTLLTTQDRPRYTLSGSNLPHSQHICAVCPSIVAGQRVNPDCFQRYGPWMYVHLCSPNPSTSSEFDQILFSTC